MDSLPEELLQHVIDFLNTDPPSMTASAQEPELHDLFTDERPLKNLALVARKYHRLVDPVLYQYLRVHVDSIPTDQLPVLLSELDVADENRSSKLYQLREWEDPADGSRFLARLSRASRQAVELVTDAGVVRSLSMDSLSATDRYYVDLLYDHVIAEDVLPTADASVDDDAPQSRQTDFLSFLKRKRRAYRTSAQSLVVYYSDTPAADSNTPHAERPDWQRSRIWDAIRPYINPERLVIMASPARLTEMVSCYSDNTDAWAFHIPFQRVELKQRPRPSQPASMSERERNYTSFARYQSSSVLLARYWDSLEYDEGSSLNAYGTYHYFEKVGRAHTTLSSTDVHILQRPPSILNRNSVKLFDFSTWLRRLTYTAVFPHFAHFSSVLDMLSEFRALAVLTVQFAPDAKSTLLDDQERIGRGNMRLADCWSELEQCYFGVANRLLKHDETPLWLLDRFEPLDYKNQFLIELLDRVLHELGPPWVKCDDGAWEKRGLPQLPAPAAEATSPS